MKKSINTDRDNSKKWIIPGGLPIGFMLVLVIIWEMIIRIVEVPNYILPAPTAIVSFLFANFGLLMSHTKTTIVEALLGLFLAVVFSLFLAMIMNRFKTIKQMIYPLLVVSQTVPIIAVAPLFMIWFGFGMLPKILIVILVCFFPIVVNLTHGLENVDQDLVDLMGVMQANSIQIFTKVQLPAILPSFFSGLKIAATYSVMGAVIAEWVGAKSGLGVYMIRVMRAFMTDALFADILIIVILSIGLFQLISFVEKKVMPWKGKEN